MPRKRNRNANLHRRLRENKGTALPDDLKVFQDHLNGLSPIEIDNPAPDGAKTTYAVFLLPFGRDYDAAGTNPRIRTGASGYAMNMWFSGSNRRIAVTNADALLGHDASQAEKDDASAIDGFYPALVRTSVSRSGAVVDTNKVSKVTGKPYKYLPKRSAQMPFGRNNTTPEDDYLERKDAIAEALGALDPSPSFGFEAEVWQETPIPEVEFDPNNAAHAVPVN